MTVLITGGCGFLGRHLARSLVGRRTGVTLLDARALSGQVDGLDDPHVRVALADITDAEAVEAVVRRARPDVVIHAAAVVGVAATAADPRPVVETNMLGALNVLEACAAVGVRRMLDISSEEVYGDFPADPMSEDGGGEPLSPYGIAKRAVEQLGRYFSVQRDVSYVAARLCWVYGPGFPRTRLPLPWLEDAVARRHSVLDTGADHRIDFTYVSDAVDGILALADAPALQHAAYNIATGVGTSLRELAEVMRTLWPSWDVKLGGGALELAPDVPAARKGALDITRIGAELGYRPVVSLADGLWRTGAELAREAATAR